MVTEEEIAHVAKLMKINLEDHSDHVKRVQKMLEDKSIKPGAEALPIRIVVLGLPSASCEVDFLNMKKARPIQIAK